MSPGLPESVWRTASRPASTPESRPATACWSEAIALGVRDATAFGAGLDEALVISLAEAEALGDGATSVWGDLHAIENGNTAAATTTYAKLQKGHWASRKR